MIEPSNKPSFRICERIQDNHRIHLAGEYISWSTFKSRYPDWDFEVENEDETNRWVRKCTSIWLRIGQKLCDEFTMEYNPDCSDFAENIGAQPHHIVLLLDSSGSMKLNNRWTSLMNTVENFLENRSRSTGDVVTIICFGSHASVEVSGTTVRKELAQNLKNFEYVNNKTGSATDYSKAVTCLNRVLEQRNDEKFVIIFMSDGEAANPANEIEILKQQRAKIFKYWSVGFGNAAANFSILRSMATEMNGEFKDPSDAFELEKVYCEIARKLD